MRTSLLVAAAVLLSAAALSRPGVSSAAAPSAAVSNAAPAQSFHNEMSMRLQEAEFAKLGFARDGSQAPRGIDPALWKLGAPPDGAPDAARVELGRKLYFERRLSTDTTVACATCHDVSRGFTDQRPVSEGVGGKLGRRNAPTTLNAALFDLQFWDGRARNVEHQAGMPILNPIEMGTQTEEQVVAHLAAIPEYAQAFQSVFGRAIRYEDIGTAIGAFERTLIALDAPFDRFQAGDAQAMSEEARKGFDLYNGRARCVACHPINAANPLGMDFDFHNIGVSARDQDFEGLARKALAELERDGSEHALDRLALETDLSQLGRFVVTRNHADIGSFKTSQLRNVGLTAPYMHDGTLQTLWDVMDHYNKGGEDNPYLDGGIEALALTEDEVSQVVAFLFALTDVRFDAANRRALDEQRAQAAKKRPFRDDDLALRKKLGFEERVLGKDR